MFVVFICVLHISGVSFVMGLRNNHGNLMVSGNGGRVSCLVSVLMVSFVYLLYVLRVL